jgi:hypothetical protein
MKIFNSFVLLLKNFKSDFKSGDLLTKPQQGKPSNLYTEMFGEEKEMKPGRELDALVAEKVMGFDVYPNNSEFLPADTMAIKFNNVPCYSTDIAAAWDVRAKMLERGYKLELRSDSFGSIANFYNDRDNNWCKEYLDAPHAICLAALKAMCAI